MMLWRLSSNRPIHPISIHFLSCPNSCRWIQYRCHLLLVRLKSTMHPPIALKLSRPCHRPRDICCLYRAFADHASAFERGTVRQNAIVCLYFTLTRSSAAFELCLECARCDERSDSLPDIDSASELVALSVSVSRSLSEVSELSLRRYLLITSGRAMLPRHNADQPPGPSTGTFSEELRCTPHLNAITISRDVFTRI